MTKRERWDEIWDEIKAKLHMENMQLDPSECALPPDGYDIAERACQRVAEMEAEIDQLKDAARYARDILDMIQTDNDAVGEAAALLAYALHNESPPSQ